MTRPVRRRSGRERDVGLLTALLATALLAGCGVQPTGVIDAGDAPSGVRSFGRLYFVRDAAVRPVLRQLLDDPPDLTQLLALLGNGPTEGERSVGLTTQLPADMRPVAAPVVTESDVTVVAFVPGLRRTSLASVQISCTVASGLTGDKARLRGAIRLSTGVGPVISLDPCPDEIRTAAPVCLPQCVTPTVPPAPQPAPARSAPPSAVGRSRRRCQN